MKLRDYLDQYDKLKNIKRFNMETVLEPQNLCDHSHGVATIFYILCKDLGINVRPHVLFRILHHDFSETFTGDINRRIQNFNDVTKISWSNIEDTVLPADLKEYTDYSLKSYLIEEEFMIFEIADEMEATLYCYREVKKGNKFMIKPLEIYINIITPKIEYLKIVELLSKIEKIERDVL